MGPSADSGKTGEEYWGAVAWEGVGLGKLCGSEAVANRCKAVWDLALGLQGLGVEYTVGPCREEVECWHLMSALTAHQGDWISSFKGC